MAHLIGTVYREGTKERVSGAMVTATTKGEDTKVVITDANGKFDFDIASGSWTVMAMGEDSLPSDKETLDLMKNIPDHKIYLPRISSNQDARAGKIMFWAFVFVLILFAFVYILSHVLTPEWEPARFQFWGNAPLRYLEILYWGLGGILVNKIITIGWYLRSSRFYREGIIMHISHLLATPLMVLVVTLLLSVASLDVTLAGNVIKLDLSKTEILIAFAFILGTSPWPLWNFVEDAGKKFLDGRENK